MTAELMNIQKLNVQKILYKEDATQTIFRIELLNTSLNVIYADTIRFREISIIIR